MRCVSCAKRLGADAVVLSNRTMDDGSVEIVALADSDLAAITPKAPRARRRRIAGCVDECHGWTSRARRTARHAGCAPMQANPYASGMPDVFSSVFGASPEAGAENSGNDASNAI